MKQDGKFFDLNERQLRTLVATSKTLTIALELIEKTYGRKIVRQIVAQGHQTTSSMSSEELKKLATEFEQTIDEKAKKLGYPTRVYNPTFING